MPNLFKLPTWTGKRDVHAIVETPRSARAKLFYDPKLRAFVMSKSLMLGLTYPYDWGFIPSTAGEDGDPLDVMVIHDATTSPGLVLRCKVIGALLVVQVDKGKRERNDRVFAVPLDSHLEQGTDDVRAWPRPQREELEKFFVATDELQSKRLKFEGWVGPKKACSLIKKAEKKFAKKDGHKNGG